MNYNISITIANVVTIDITFIYVGEEYILIIMNITTNTNVFNMIQIKNVKIGKSGRHYFITIPKNYVDNGIINPDFQYNVDLSIKIVKEEQKIAEATP